MKKRKRTSDTPTSIKKKKSRKSCPVPELILCADELKAEVELDHKLLDCKPKLEEVLSSEISLKLEPQELKPEEFSPVRAKKKKKKSIVPPEPTIEAKVKTKKKRKSKSAISDEISAQQTFEPSAPLEPSDQLLNNTEILNLSGFISDHEEHVGLNSVKEEPLTPEKQQLKIEPYEIKSLFNSNIKQVRIYDL